MSSPNFGISRDRFLGPASKMMGEDSLYIYILELVKAIRTNRETGISYYFLPTRTNNWSGGPCNAQIPWSLRAMAEAPSSPGAVPGWLPSQFQWVRLKKSARLQCEERKSQLSDDWSCIWLGCRVDHLCEHLMASKTTCHGFLEEILNIEVFLYGKWAPPKWFGCLLWPRFQNGLKIKTIFSKQCAELSPWNGCARWQTCYQHFSASKPAFVKTFCLRNKWVSSSKMLSALKSPFLWKPNAFPEVDAFNDKGVVNIELFFFVERILRQDLLWPKCSQCLFFFFFPETQWMTPEWMPFIIKMLSILNPETCLFWSLNGPQMDASYEAMWNPCLGTTKCRQILDSQRRHCLLAEKLYMQ